MKEEIEIAFLGGAGTVTGSKFLVSYAGTKVLIDCGLFQGMKELRLMNWEPLPTAVHEIDAVLLTHGHLDHVGYLPRLRQQGFNGFIYGTGPTLAIAEIILRDSAKIQEEEASRANRDGYSKHKPALPFYTVEQAEQTAGMFREVPLEQWQSVGPHIHYRMRYNGHILGSAYIELQIKGKILVFSGDVGRPDDPLLYDPKTPDEADYLFVESTYGDRLHPQDDFKEVVVPLIEETLADRGVLVMPSFAVERLQALMYLLWKGQRGNQIPYIPVYVDSPMGNRVLEVFSRYTDWHKLSDREFRHMFDHAHVVTSYEQTWEVIQNKAPKIVIAGSGMVTGGRVLTYLQQLLDNPSTRVLLVGYQAEGTRGRYLKEGAEELKIYGKLVPVKAKIHCIDSLSAHGDQSDLLGWMSHLKNTPKAVYLIHGEPQAQAVFAQKIEDQFGWPVHIPQLHETIRISV